MSMSRTVCKRYEGNCTITPEFCAKRHNRALAEPYRIDLDLCRECTKGRRQFMRIYDGKVVAKKVVKICMVEGCNAYAQARGYCFDHYREGLRMGTIKTKSQVIDEVRTGFMMEEALQE